MADFEILCDEYDFSALAAAFGGEFECDIPASVEVVIVDGGEIRRLNKQFRSIDKETDVLSFPALDGILGKAIKGEEHPCEIEDGVLNLGSVAICKQVAEKQAEEYGHSFERELFYLLTHGICHVLGYDHMTESDKAAMREKEEKVLAKLDLSR